MPRESIRDRSVYVYLPTVQLFQDWKGRAKKSHVPLSKFVFEHATNSLRQEDGEESYKPRAGLIQDLRKRDEEIQKLTRENEIVKLALDRVENELRRYRLEPFLDENFRGIRRYDRKLVDLLKKGDTINSDHLLHRMRINPKETDLVKAVANQLENLEAYGLIQKTRRGWKWIAK